MYEMCDCCDCLIPDGELFIATDTYDMQNKVCKHCITEHPWRHLEHESGKEILPYKEKARFYTGDLTNV